MFYPLLLRRYLGGAIVWVLMAVVCANLQAQYAGQSAIFKQDASLLFIENKGQVTDIDGSPTPQVLFTTGSNGIKLFITSSGIHYQFARTQKLSTATPDRSIPETINPEDSFKTTVHRVFMQLKGSNPHPEIVKELQSSYYENYFLPQCQQGITHVNSYQKITFKNVYESIDWVLYSLNGVLKYDFIVKPGANPKNIQLCYAGQDSLSLNANGSLSVFTSLGTIKEAAPVLYQNSKQIKGKFTLIDNTVSFTIPQFDNTLPLVIDPELVWATYYGGNGNQEAAAGTCADKENNIYFSGSTNSSMGIAFNGYINNYYNGFQDAFLVKFDENGNRLWATYFGGENTEFVVAPACDNNLDVYLGVYTKSSSQLKGTVNQLNNAGGPTDIYVAKFAKDGAFRWGTFIGGTDWDNISGIVPDQNDDIYVCGYSTSTSGIALNGYINDNTTYQTYGIIVKLSSTGSKIWGTYFGGNVAGGCIDSNNDLYITGDCQPTTGKVFYNGFKSNFEGGYYDAYLAKFSPMGNILWSTYYGGEYTDNGLACGVDNADNIYLMGQTASRTQISYNGYKNAVNDIQDPTFNQKILDGFIVKFNSSGNRQWATYFGSDTFDNVFKGYVNKEGIYIVGSTLGKNYPTKNPLFKSTITNNDSGDGFIAKLNPSGQLEWSTLFGSDNYEYVNNVSGDYKGNIIFTAGSRNYAISGFNGYMPQYGGSSREAPILVKIKDASLYIDNISPANPYCTKDALTIKYGANILLNAGNMFTFQLSDSLGSFSNPLSFGTKVSTTVGSDSVTLTLPSNIPSGSKYYIRVLSSDSKDSSLGFGPLEIVNPKLAIGILGSQAACKGDTTIIAAPLHPNYTCQWYFEGNPVLNEKQNTLKTTQPGKFYALLSTTGGCTEFSDTITTNPITTFTVGFTGDTVKCEGAAITFTDTSSVVGGHNRHWKLTPTDTSNQAAFQHTFTTQGQYNLTLRVTTPKGCQDSVNKTITILSSPSGFITTDKDTILCPNDSITLTLITEQGNSIQWFKNNSPINQATDSFYTASQKGLYQATATNAGGCSNSVSINVSSISPPLSGFIAITKNGVTSKPIICTDDNDVLELSSLLQGNLLWEPYNTSTPALLVSDTGWVYLTTTSNNGCQFKDSVKITDGCDNTLFVPNAFTPGKKDAYNPTFKVVGTNITDYKIQIFNFWGEKVFDSNSLYDSWDGTYNNAQCPAGTYLYLISYMGNTKKGYQQKSNAKGTLLLIR